MPWGRVSTVAGSFQLTRGIEQKRNEKNSQPNFTNTQIVDTKWRIANFDGDAIPRTDRDELADIFCFFFLLRTHFFERFESALNFKNCWCRSDV